MCAIITFYLPLPFNSPLKWHGRAKDKIRKSKKIGETGDLNFFRSYKQLVLLLLRRRWLLSLLLFYCADDLKLGVGLWFFVCRIRHCWPSFSLVSFVLVSCFLYFFLVALVIVISNNKKILHECHDLRAKHCREYTTNDFAEFLI